MLTASKHGWRKVARDHADGSPTLEFLDIDDLNPEQDFVLKTVESRDVHFVRCWFSDVLGNM